MAMDRSWCTYFLFSVLVLTNFITLVALFYREWWLPPIDFESGLEAGKGTSEEKNEASWSAEAEDGETEVTTPPTPCPEVEQPKDPLKLPKVAICVVGALRTFFHPKVRELMKANLFDASVTRPEDRQIFFDVTTSSHCEARPRDHNEISHCMKFNERVVKRENFVKIIQSDPTLNSSLYQFSDDINCKHPYLQQEPCCGPRVRADTSAMGGYLAYQRKRHCYEWALEYEASKKKEGSESSEEDFHFDWFIFARPDVAFFDPVPLMADLERRSPRIYAISKEGGQPISDFFYIVPRPLAADFIHAVRTVYDGDCQKMLHFDWPPEFHLHPYWDTLPIPRQLLPISLSIVHEAGNADCWRLTNEVNNHGRPFLLNGKAVSAADYCSNIVNQEKAFDPNLIPEYQVSPSARPPPGPPRRQLELTTQPTRLPRPPR